MGGFDLETPDRDIFDSLIAAGQTLDKVFPLEASRNDVPHETSSVAQRRDRSFFPALPERLVCALVPLPGKAWAVFLALWRECAINHSLEVTLTSTFLKRLGVTHDQKARAVAALKAAGLITVDQQVGKNPTATLCVATPPWKRSC
jgi:hypothetical protein